MRRKIQVKKKTIIFVIFFTFSLLLTPFIILSTNSTAINLKNNSDAEIILSNNSAERGGGNEQTQSQNISPPNPNTQKGNVFRKDWNWTEWYDGSSDPTSEGWTLNETMDGQGAQWDQYNGILNISTLGERREQWYYSKPVNLNSSKGYTINFRMKINDPVLKVVDRNFQWMDGQIIQTLRFQRDMIKLDPGSLSEGNYNYNMTTDDKYHDYWICCKNNFVRVWIDNVNVWNFTCKKPTSLNEIAFGDINPGSNGGETLWNYIRWYEEGEIVPWRETGTWWWYTFDASWREWRNDFDYIFLTTGSLARAEGYRTILENDCYERQAFLNIWDNAGEAWGGREAFAELAINDTLFYAYMADFCAIVDVVKDYSALRAFVIGDETPVRWNNKIERYMKYDTPSFNITELIKTDAGRLKVLEWATEKNTEALNRIYYHLKEYLDDYDIEVYQHVFLYTDARAIQPKNFVGVNFSGVIGDGYVAGCYLNPKMFTTQKFSINQKLYFLNRYATLYPNKPFFVFINGGVGTGLTPTNKTLLEKNMLEICSVPGNIHIGYFTICSTKGAVPFLIHDRGSPQWKPEYEDIWNILLEASSFFRSQPLLTRKPQKIAYIIPHYLKYYANNRFPYLSPAFWIPRTINYDVYSTKEILNNFNKKPINNYSLVIISCCFTLDQEELELLRSWNETWKIWMIYTGFKNETNNERGYQSFWNITSENWEDGFNWEIKWWGYDIDATDIGMSFDYTIFSPGHYGNCSFDENGDSLVSFSNENYKFHLLVKYTDRNGFGEYWLGHRNFLYNGIKYDLFSAIIEWCLKDRGFYTTEQEFKPIKFTLSSDADNPDGDGRFTLKWVESLFADNYSIYTSDSYITEISDNLTLIGEQEADQPFFSAKALNKDAGTYYYIVEAHNKYGNTISNCIKVDVRASVRDLWNFTTEDGVFSSPALGDMDGDDKLETVFGSLDGKVYALNGENGNELWNFATGTMVYSSPALGDVDGDGKLEVVFGSLDGKVYALNGENGSELWSFTTGNIVYSSPALGDVDGDNKLEVVIGSFDGKVYALNGEDGSELWSFTTGNMILSSPALGDVDDDGKLEAVIGSLDGKIYALNGEDGSELWSFTTGDSVYSSPALGDLDGDGKLEVVIGSYDFKVYALKPKFSGEIIAWQGLSGDSEFYRRKNLNSIVFKTSPTVITGGDDWADLVATEGWVTGSGTISDPYIISGLEIDGAGAESCISIENSDVYFQIENCKFSGASVGITLVNVANGEIINNDCSNNGESGIVLIDCDNIILSGNIGDGNVFGIYLLNSHNNLISGNILKYDCYGIFLKSSSYNTISDNIIMHHLCGIKLLYNSNYNVISGNTVSNNLFGIFVLSHYNQITGNSINNNLIGILCGKHNLVSENTFNNNLIDLKQHRSRFYFFFKRYLCFHF